MKTATRSKKQSTETKQAESYIEDHSDDYYTSLKIGIADQLWFGDCTLHENSLYELTTLAGCISRAVGAITKENSGILETPADNLSHLLITIKKAIEINTEKSRKDAIAVIDAAVELAFLHSPAYRAALKLFEIDHSCAMASGDERNAFEVIRTHIAKSVKEDRGRASHE
jgi:hypothetical protein